MVPDMADCEKLLGGPRGVRYVAQENLEPISPRECAVVHELLPHFFEAFDAKSGRFVPVEQLRYWYPADDPVASIAALPSAVEGCIERLQALLHAHMLEARREGLLAPLLELLRHASSADEARVAESAATTLLAAHQSLPLRALTNEVEFFF